MGSRQLVCRAPDRHQAGQRVTAARSVIVGTPAEEDLRLVRATEAALEPWFARTTDRIAFDPDGWTICAADGSRTAHSEHTLAITDDGPVVLTRRLPESRIARGDGDGWCRATSTRLG